MRALIRRMAAESMKYSHCSLKDSVRLDGAVLPLTSDCRYALQLGATLLQTGGRRSMELEKLRNRNVLSRFMTSETGSVGSMASDDMTVVKAAVDEW